MSNELYDFNIGHSTAYAYAKASGDLPEGMTPDEYGELLAAYATVGQTAVDAKNAAVAANTAAQTAATTATNKASEATTAAQTATTKAGEAVANAEAAARDASQAMAAESVATSKASEATTAAATATSAATTATTAKDDAVSAKTAAQTAQTGAETAAASVQSSAAQIATNTEDIGQLKNTLSDVNEELTYIEKFTGAEWISGYINSSGTFTGNQADRAVTSYVPCPPYASVTYVGENNHSNICGISFYDKDFAFISGDINSGTLGDAVTVTSPAGTKYLRVSTKTSILSDSYFRFDETKNNVLSSLQGQIVRDTVYVNGTNGSDSTGNGSMLYPYATITRALADGIFNVCIAPGTYNEALSFDHQRFHLFAIQQPYSDSALTRPKVILDGGSSLSCGLTIYYPPELILEGITFQNYTANGCYIIYGENIQIKDCTFANNGSNGLRIDSVDALVADCVAYSNTKDGFNINGYGSTQFINCCGHDNGDDGISHHQGTVGVIIGGEWYNNVKGGVASPCYGAKVDIHNVYSHDNGYGIYAYATNLTDAQGFKIWDCVLTNNSNYGIAVKYNQPTLYNNKVSGNTIGQTTAYGTVSFITLD